MRKPLLLSCVVLGASSVAAQAVGFRTQMNCASDYYAYCSQHAPGSAGVRKCMRAVGPKLSKACINALIADGEVSKAEVEAQKQKLAAAKAKPKQAEPKKEDVAAASNKSPQDSKKEAKKIDVAQKKQAPADTKSSASKVAAAATATNPSAAAPAITPAVTAVNALAAPATPAAKPQRQMVSLDQETFEALKNRGPVFVAEEGSSATAVAQPAAMPAAKPSVTAISGTDSWQPEAGEEPAAARPATADSANEPDDGEAPEILAQAGTEDVQQPRDYPAGRMSLGRKLASVTATAEPSSWWDQLVEAVTGD